MASPKLLRGRVSQIGATFSVTTVTRDRAALFFDPILADIVRMEIRRCDGSGLVATHAWVVMPDHVHWMFELREGSLGCCLQVFKSHSARAINAAMNGDGRVWQTGYYDHCLRSNEDLLGQARYLMMIPVRNGLAERIEDYPHAWCRWIKRSAAL